MQKRQFFAKLAAKYNKSNAQIILKWHIQSGHIIIPGSRNLKHIKQNADLFDFTLTGAEMKEIAKADKNKRYYTSSPSMLKMYENMPLDPKKDI